MRLRIYVKSSVSMINYNMKSVGTIAKVVYSVHLLQNLNNVITTVFFDIIVFLSKLLIKIVFIYILLY